ncbi:MAG: radical SAM protein [Bacilli bacterium]|nr:radical SAM protein [Bacilli bacterium]
MNTFTLKELFEKGERMHHITNTAYPLRPTSLLRYKIKDAEEIRDLLKNDISKIDELALYVHVPFCQSRCKFCEYAVVSGDDFDKKEEYVQALLKEIDMYKEIVGDKKILGYDIGGGTPTQLEIDQLKRITEKIFKTFNFDENTEASIETTPVIAARDFDKIASLYDMGYRRISMGIQTINPKLLEAFGREGNNNIYKSACENIRAAGFKKFNVDLMYGFLNQDMDDFKATLEYAISLKPEYITLYRNRYKGTKIAEEAEHVTLDKVNNQYKEAWRILNAAGYETPYGKNTFSRIKNDYGTSDYLTKRVIEGLPYIGMGLGAQSFGYQYLAYNSGAATKTLKNYFTKIEKGEFPIQDIYPLPISEAISKMISVAFYFAFLDLNNFKKRFNIDFLEYFKEEVEFLTNQGFIEIKDGMMIVTEKGVENVGGVIPMFYTKESREELMNMTGMF